MLTGYTNKPIEPALLKDIWSNYFYEGRIVYKKDGIFHKRTIIPEDTFEIDYDTCFFAFSYKADSSFPFTLDWGNKWIYVSIEGDSLVDTSNVSKLKDILEKLSYEGAKAVLTHLVEIKPKKFIIIDCGQITHSNDFIQHDGHYFSNENYKKKVVHTSTHVTKPSTTPAHKQEMVLYEGVRFGVAGPGFKKYMIGDLMCDIYVDDILPSSPWNGILMPLDFISSISFTRCSITSGIKLHDFGIYEDIKFLSVHRLENLDNSKAPIKITHLKKK